MRWGRATPDPAALQRAADWLLAREIRRPGDWAVKRPHAEPSGWAFEYRNEFYPDIDDTAMALLASSRARASDAAAQQACQRRALDWLLAMQSQRWRLGRLRRRQQLALPAATSPSPITTPCSTPPAPISPAARWRPWRRTA